MEQNTPSNQELALRLFSVEKANASSADELQDAIERTFGKLSLHLTRRLGSGGYHALLKRAVTLAAVDFPWFVSVRITDHAMLEGIDFMSPDRAVEETEAGCVAALARLIELLDTFIGRKLCLRVLRDVWSNEGGAATGSQGDRNG